MNIDDINDVTEANKWATNDQSEIESIVINGGKNLYQKLGEYFQNLDLLRLKFVFDVDSYKGDAIKLIAKGYNLNHQGQMKRSDKVLEYSKNNRESIKF